ncbi:MAG: hypothetical protein JST40_09700 [Armatimonadetes bacterium]|nr:hypothetical protein [Armatimonadota bacterium]
MNLLADFEPALLIPILTVALIFGIPIIAILTAHQRKMAELMHGNPANNNHLIGEVQALRHEVQQLKEMLHTQMLANDRPALSVPPPVQASDQIFEQIRQNQ